MRHFEPLILGRCRLVPFSESHLTPRYVEWLNDREVVRYSEQRHQTHSLESCDAYFHGMVASEDLFLAIEASDLALGHIGNISVSFDQANLTADVAIMIGEAAARGHGLATEAWRGIVDWLLGSGDMRRVTAGTMEINGPMIALMRNSGMTIECVRPRAFLYEGHEVGLVLAARFAPLRA